MSVMSELHLDIVDMLTSGQNPFKIAAELEIPISMVFDIEAELDIDEYSQRETINS